MARRPRPVGCLLMPNQITDLVLPAHMAVANLGAGSFGSSQWHDLATFCDVIQLLAHDAGQEDVLALAIRVNEALLSIRARHDRVARWGASGDELRQIRDAINPLDHFMRRQTSHKVRAALLRLDAALTQAQALGEVGQPIVIDPSSLPTAASH